MHIYIPVCVNEAVQGILNPDDFVNYVLEYGRTQA